jgi:hypothetical protein
MEPVSLVGWVLGPEVGLLPLLEPFGSRMEPFSAQRAERRP